MRIQRALAYLTTYKCFRWYSNADTVARTHNLLCSSGTQELPHFCSQASDYSRRNKRSQQKFVSSIPPSPCQNVLQMFLKYCLMVDKMLPFIGRELSILSQHNSCLFMTSNWPFTNSIVNPQVLYRTTCKEQNSTRWVDSSFFVLGFSVVGGCEVLSLRRCEWKSF